MHCQWVVRYMMNFQHWLHPQNFFNVICSTIQSLNVCEGNSDDFFIEMIRNKGGEIKKNETVMAFF